MKISHTLFLIFGLISCVSLEARSKSSSLRRLKLRVGDTKTLRGYDAITADPKNMIHITVNRDDEHELTGMKEGMVVLKFYQDGEEIAEKAIQVRAEREEPDVNVSFGFGFGAYPRRYYYSSDPFYDPLYGWGAPHWGYWHRRNCHHGHCH